MQKGRTPLWEASWMGHLPVVQLLVERGANLEVADEVDIIFKYLHTS